LKLLQKMPIEFTALKCCAVVVCKISASSHSRVCHM
jgi:hypothetical protein